MAGSIARQPWRLGIPILLLVLSMAGLLFAQAFFGGDSEPAAEEIVESGSGPITSTPLVSPDGNPPGISAPLGDQAAFNPEDEFSLFATYDDLGSQGSGPAPPDTEQPQSLPAIVGHVEEFAAQIHAGGGGGSRLGNVRVFLADGEGNFTGRSAITDAAGGFRFEELAPGRFKLYFADPNGSYRPGWYGEDIIPGGSVLTLGMGAEANITYVMWPMFNGGGTIAGRVTDGAGDGVPGVDVLAYLVDTAAGTALELKGATVTDDDGYYHITNLPATDNYSVPGSNGAGYKVLFSPPPETGFSDQWYRGQPTHVTAKMIELGEGKQVTADATLSGGGTLSGRVTIDGQPMPRVLVDIFDSGGVIVESRWTDSDGRYQTGELAEGTYKVRVLGNELFYEEWYEGKRDFATADPVAVTRGNDTGSVDISLDWAIPGLFVEPDSGVAPEAGTFTDEVISQDAVNQDPDEDELGEDGADEDEAGESPTAPPGSDDGASGGEPPAGQGSESALPPHEHQGQVSREGSHEDVPAR